MVLFKHEPHVGQIEWQVEPDLVPYLDAVAFMEQRADEIRKGVARGRIWLLQHPPIYTAGTSADDDEVTGIFDFPVYRTGRGGRHTYHGPGQRIVYVMLDLKRLGCDVRRFVWLLEEWVIRSLSEFGLEAERREGRVGVWVAHRGSEAKVAALGVRLRRWVSFHGISINVSPDLRHFGGIIPCGISEYGVTSFEDLGLNATMDDLDCVLKQQFSALFSASQDIVEVVGT